MIILSKRRRYFKTKMFKYLDPLRSINNQQVYTNEEPLEFDTFKLVFEYDENVSKYDCSPFILSFNEIEEAYTPNFFIQKHNHDKFFIDIKELKTVDVERIKDFNIFCKNNDIIYKTISYHDTLKSVQYHNAKFLLPYQADLFKVNYDDLIIEEFLNINGKVEIGQALDSIFQSDDNKMKYLYYIWMLIANNLLNYNRDQRLSMKTIIWNL